MVIEDLGYNEFFEQKRTELGLGGFAAARVTAEFKGAYRVKNADGEFLAKVTGRQMYNAESREDFPAVGDWVAISEPNGGRAVVRGILPRKAVIKRAGSGKDGAQIIAANIDTAFVVESVGRDFNLNRLERYFAIAKAGGAEPVIVLNKTDLASPEELETNLSLLKGRFPGIGLILTSTKHSRGLSELSGHITKGKTYCFLGSSGVGKSSLINKLLGREIIKTKDISPVSSRGQHTTTKREMYFLQNGGIVIDNPGMREVGMAEAGGGINEVFEEIAALARSCKFSNCSHTHEPGCKVTEAVKLGGLDEQKYANFLKLKKEAEYYKMDDFKKREKDRRFGKLVKKAKKELKDYSHKGW